MIKSRTAAVQREGCSTLRISYDEDVDFLLALAPGEVIDGQMDDEIEEPRKTSCCSAAGPAGR